MGAQASIPCGSATVCLGVMDGHYTEKLTWGPMMIKSLRAHGITAPIDVQLTCSADIVDVQIEEFACSTRIG